VTLARPLVLVAVLASACTDVPTPTGPAAPALTLPPIPIGAPAPRPARPVVVRVVGPAGGVADARVCAARIGGEERCAASGPDGRATVELVPGTYAIRATPAPGRRLTEGVAVVDLTESTSAVVSIEGRATISGTVRDTGGRPVGGAQACAHSATASEVACARSRADGTYTVEVRPGVQKLEVIGPSDGSRLIDQWARGRISSDEADVIDTRVKDVGGVDVTLIKGVVLAGTVTAARGGSAVKAAQVCTYTLAAPLGWDCDRTDKNGRYAVLREPGTYWVWVIPPGDRGSRLMYQRYDRVLEGVDATPFDLTRDRQLDVALTEGVVLRGRVTTPEGEPVVLALVCADTPFPTGRICRGTGDDGIYEIATRPQTYVVQVIPPAGSDLLGGFWPDSQPDWIRAGEIRVGAAGAGLDIVLSRGVLFSGTVRDALGAPIEAATINLNDASGPRFFTSTGIDGRYGVAVRPGSYTVDVFPPRSGHSLSVVDQAVTVSGDTGYDVVLPDIAQQ
jgi:hypothetical protein